MRIFGLRMSALFVLVTLAALWSGSARAFENSVVVESKTVTAGEDSVRVSISIDNNFPVYYIFLPLEIRCITPGAFIASHVSLSDNPNGRVYSSGLSEDEDGCWPWPGANPSWSNQLGIANDNDCSGPQSNSYTNNYPDSSPFVSPDGFSLLADGTSCGPLAPGTDPADGDSASFMFRFAVSSITGHFEIDTCCVIGGHLAFGDINGYVVPKFTKGVIEIDCDCSCHGDPLCDGLTDVIDVIRVIDRAFRGAEATVLQSCSGQAGTIDGVTDLDCSGNTDVQDVLRIVEIVFRGGDRVLLTCNPCE